MSLEGAYKCPRREGEEVSMPRQCRGVNTPIERGEEVLMSNKQCFKAALGDA